jgi:hypothetical protein
MALPDCTVMRSWQRGCGLGLGFSRHCTCAGGSCERVGRGDDRMCASIQLWYGRHAETERERERERERGGGEERERERGR